MTPGTVTVHVGGGEPLASLDDGTTAVLPPASAAEVARLAEEALAAGPVRFGGTAATAAGIAEARAVRPVEDVRPPAPGPLVDLADPARTAEGVPVTDLGPSRPLADVLARRSSRRDLCRAGAGPLLTAVARAGLVRAGTAGDGAVPVRTACPSAGGRQPFALVVVANDVDGLEDGGWVLDSDRAVLLPSLHTAENVAAANGAVAAALRREAPPPAVVLAVARPAATLGRYPSGLSLLWREAGALLTVLHLAAADLGLGSCLVGTAGVLHDGTGPGGGLFDMGAVAVGGIAPGG